MESGKSFGEQELLLMEPDQIRELVREDINWQLSNAAMRRIFEACDALWLHDGDPQVPHAKLTSGKCSNGFVNVLQVLSYTNLCLIMEDQLVRVLRKTFDGKVDWVIGSDHAAATISFAVAARLGARHDFTEKGPNKTQIWKRFQIEPDATVLQVEELITTTGTLQRVRDGVRLGNKTEVNFLPVSMTLVHRSDVTEFEDGEILYPVHWDIEVWDDPSKCPLCQEGSEPIRPKENWARLTAKV